MEQIPNRIAALREAMNNTGIAAYIIPGTDPHASEYIADNWKERVWISGFNGSAGTAVIGLEQAGLWTDSRYFLQADDQLEGSGIELMKQGLPDTLSIVQWLMTSLKPGQRVGVNSQLFSVNAFATLKADLKLSGIELVSIDLVFDLWTDRPALPTTSFFAFDTKYAGKSAAQKLTELRAEIKKAGGNTFVISALDDIAWLFNIRGNDVSYNPVVTAFALIEKNTATLFVAPAKLTVHTKQYLTNEGVAVAPYQEIYAALRNIQRDETVLLDGTKINQSLFEAIPTQCTIRNVLSPVSVLKSIKNETEIAGYRRAMVKDGVALTRFFKWLEENVASCQLTETSVDRKLLEFRSQQPDFMGASFSTISSYGPHGAIVHYSPTEETAFTLKPEGMYLLDSGGQYLDGTTDITRTITLGNVTAQQKSDFTLVLKGHIALASVTFPVNTRGSQLDVLARKAMWDKGINYGHGTGHGVGHFLNVHEGPQNIRSEENPTVLQAGMVLSNEPGLYRTDEYGIRTECLILIVPAMKTEFGEFLHFETLTQCYIDKQLIDSSMITTEEKIWINNYHQTVFEKLSPSLTDDERNWLQQKCSPLD